MYTFVISYSNKLEVKSINDNQSTYSSSSFLVL